MIDRGTIIKVRLTYEGDEPYQSDAKIEIIGVVGSVELCHIENLIFDAVNEWDELRLDKGKEGFVEATMIERHDIDDVFYTYWLEPIEVTEKFYA